MHVCLKPNLHTHTECGLNFLPLYHISCMRGYYSTLLNKDVFSGYYVSGFCPVKVNNLAFIVRVGPNILWRDPQGWLRSNRFLDRTILCKPVGNFVSSHPSMSRSPIQCHCVLGGDIIQCLLALSYQWRRVSSLNGFQSHLTIRANINIYV